MIGCTPDTTVIGFGELLWDIFPAGRRPGGAPANVAFHATQFGARGIVCSRVGRDPLGDELLDHLRRHGLDPRHVQVDPARPTGGVTVEAVDPTHPRFTIHEDAAWDHVAFTPEWEQLCRTADAFCFGTLIRRTIDGESTLLNCLDAARRALIVYDINLRPPWFDAARVDDSLRRAHVAKLNGDELHQLATMFSLPGRDHREQATALRRAFSLRGVCVTRGAEGCLLHVDDDVVEVPGIRVRVADAVGAGDAFTAAMTVGLLARRPLKEVAAFANKVGALVAAREGAMPDIRTELTRTP
ncbi:MAG: carbohydrate kinase [Phycisphaerae bacterium]|nr:carbohydrate kinase [Phycisphaerae bacterium]NUQ47813.1 carbohydrate kinase [Phycisphaerae bacterium]